MAGGSCSFLALIHGIPLHGSPGVHSRPRGGLGHAGFSPPHSGCLCSACWRMTAVSSHARSPALCHKGLFVVWEESGSSGHPVLCHLSPHEHCWSRASASHIQASRSLHSNGVPGGFAQRALLPAPAPCSGLVSQHKPLAFLRSGEEARFCAIFSTFVSFLCWVSGSFCISVCPCVARCLQVMMVHRSSGQGQYPA